MTESTTMDQRFLASNAALDLREAVIRRSWPEEIDPKDLCKPTLWAQCRSAWTDLLSTLGFREGELETNDATNHSCFC